MPTSSWTTFSTPLETSWQVFHQLLIVIYYIDGTLSLPTGDHHKEGQPETRTWVQDIFQGTLTNETKCLVCETVRSKDEEFLDLSVDIEQNTSLTHCLRYWTRPSLFSLSLYLYVLLSECSALTRDCVQSPSTTVSSAAVSRRPQRDCGSRNSLRFWLCIWRGSNMLNSTISSLNWATEWCSPGSSSCSTLLVVTVPSSCWSNSLSSSLCLVGRYWSHVWPDRSSGALW